MQLRGELKQWLTAVYHAIPTSQLNLKTQPVYTVLCALVKQT